MKRFVTAIIMNEARTEVVLRSMMRPENEKPMLYGLGDVVGDDELPRQALSRAVAEQLDFSIPQEKWNRVAKVQYDKTAVVLNYTVTARFVGALHFGSGHDIARYRTEEVAILPVHRALKWIIPVACDPMRPTVEAKINGVARKSHPVGVIGDRESVRS